MINIDELAEEWYAEFDTAFDIDDEDTDDADYFDIDPWEE